MRQASRAAPGEGGRAVVVHDRIRREALVLLELAHDLVDLIDLRVGLRETDGSAPESARAREAAAARTAIGVVSALGVIKNVCPAVVE